MIKNLNIISTVLVIMVFCSFFILTMWSLLVSTDYKKVNPHHETQRFVNWLLLAVAFVSVMIGVGATITTGHPLSCLIWNLIMTGYCIYVCGEASKDYHKIKQKLRKALT